MNKIIKKLLNAVGIDTRKKITLVHYPDKRLSQRCKEVERFDDDLLHAAQAMVNLLGMLPWGTPLGLAANQAGLNIRMFIKRESVKGKPGYVAYVNPAIIWKTKAPEVESLEGCYSLVPGRFDYPNMRTPSIQLEWQDLEGNFYRDRFNGEEAIVIQHELDHLNGILCNGSGRAVSGT